MAVRPGQCRFNSLVTIDAGATLGPRDVVVTTGAVVESEAGGFTVTNVDTTAPGILTCSPQYNATGVPLNTVGTAEFKEPIDRNTVTTATFRLYDYYSGVEIPGTVSVNAAGRVASFVPTQLLAVNHYHYFYLTNGIRDVAGNPFGGTTYYPTHVVIDTPAGLHGKRLDAVLRITDRMLIPVQPSLFDIQATQKCLLVADYLR